MPYSSAYNNNSLSTIIMFIIHRSHYKFCNDIFGFNNTFTSESEFNTMTLPLDFTYDNG